MKMQTKNLYELSNDELRVECLKRGVKLKGDQGDFNMVEAVVALTKKLLMDGRDPIKEEFCTSEVIETGTKAFENNSIIQEAVVALTKKLLVQGLDPIKEEDDKTARKRIHLAKSPHHGPSVIVAKSECESASKTWPDTTFPKGHRKSAQVLFPPLLTTSAPSYSCSAKIPACPIPYPVHTHVARISSNGSVFTQSPSGMAETPLTNHPHPHVIHFQPLKKLEENSVKDDNKTTSNKDPQSRKVHTKFPDPWLESLHRGLDKILFPGGCKL